MITGIKRTQATTIEAVRYSLDNALEILTMMDNHQHGYFIDENADMIIYLNGNRKPVILTEGDYIVHETINNKHYFEICKEEEYTEKFYL